MAETAPAPSEPLKATCVFSGSLASTSYRLLVDSVRLGGTLFDVEVVFKQMVGITQ